MSEKVTVEEAQKIAWKHLQMVCGHHNMKLTAGEICNDYRFFQHGWNYATRFHQRKKSNSNMKEAQEIAWEHLKMICGLNNMNLTVGEICNDYGFFLQGWNYATQCYQQMKQNNFKGEENG